MDVAVAVPGAGALVSWRVGTSKGNLKVGAVFEEERGEAGAGEAAQPPLVVLPAGMVQDIDKQSVTGSWTASAAGTFRLTLDNSAGWVGRVIFHRLDAHASAAEHARELREGGWPMPPWLPDDVKDDVRRRQAAAIAAATAHPAPGDGGAGAGAATAAHATPV
jgi:hypothetical protein